MDKNEQPQQNSNIFSKILKKIDDISQNQKENEKISGLFYSKCETYTVVDLINPLNPFSSHELKAIRNAEPDVIYVKQDEKILGKISSNMVLGAKSDNACFVVQEKDIFSPVEYQISDGENCYTVSCVRVKVKLRENTENQKPVQVITNTYNTQQISVTGDNNQVSQSINVDQQLAQIEGAIKQCKGGLFGGKKKEAERLFVNFKDCVIYKKKDDSLFQKFLKVLKEIGLAAAAEAVKKLIAGIF